MSTFPICMSVPLRAITKLPRLILVTTQVFQNVNRSKHLQISNSRISLLSTGIRSSHPEVFCKKGAFCKKGVMPQACSFMKKEALAQVFSCEFCKTPFFTEHLLWLLLRNHKKISRKHFESAILTNSRTFKEPVEQKLFRNCQHLCNR